MRVDGISYRRVAATCSAALSSLLGLRTVDDVFLHVVSWSGVGRPRSALDRLATLSLQLDLSEAAAACATIRPISSPPSFYVTANFVGKRNYNTQEIKETCAQGVLASHHGWTYADDDDDADLNLRLFIEHDVAYVGVRLGERPLHRRRYKQQHVPGSLKPSVAAAMLALAGVDSEMRLLDPCCGAGTILIEAALEGARTWGGDNDADVLAAAQANAAAAGIASALQHWDAQALPLLDSSMDRIVCNLPWGREVKVDGALKSLYRRIGWEMRRVLAPGGRVTLLTSAPQLVDLPGLGLDRTIEISLFGQAPKMLVFS